MNRKLKDESEYDNDLMKLTERHNSHVPDVSLNYWIRFFQGYRLTKLESFFQLLNTVASFLSRKTNFFKDNETGEWQKVIVNYVAWKFLFWQVLGLQNEPKMSDVITQVKTKIYKQLRTVLESVKYDFTAHHHPPTYQRVVSTIYSNPIK